MTISNRKMIEELLEEDEKGILSEWESNFIRSIEKYLNGYGSLTMKQADKLVELHMKHCMGDDR